LRKFYLTVNPHGGRRKGPRVLRQVRPVLEAAGLDLEVIQTTCPGHARDLAHQLDFTGYEGLVVVGGDGTMHEVVNGLLTRADRQAVPIGLIPAGSGNSFACDLGVLDPLAAARAVIGGQTRRIDLAEVRTPTQVTLACNIIGWGLVTDIGARAEKWRWLGPARYTLLSLVEVLRAKPRAASLVVEDHEIVDDFTFVIACNTRYTGKGMKIAPRALLDDGLMDVVVVRHRAGRMKLLSMLPRIYQGTHVDSPLVEYYPVSRFSLVPDRQEVLNVDGEVSGSTPVHVTMRPGAFEVFDRTG